jgi:hypothetical protein
LIWLSRRFLIVFAELQKERVKQQQLQELKEKEEKMLAMLTKALEMVKNEAYPSSVRDREKYFMENVQAGEMFSLQGMPFERIFLMLWIKIMYRSRENH